MIRKLNLLQISLCYLTLCLAAPVAADESASQWHLPSIQVVDENDKPVAGAEVAAVLAQLALDRLFFEAHGAGWQCDV